MNKYKLLKFIQITSAVIFITAVICIIQKLYIYREDQKDYTELTKQVVSVNENKPIDTEIKVNEESVHKDVENTESEPQIEINFDALKDINSKCVGWINACDGIINYPIVLSEDVDYYLNHGFDDKKNKSGCFFIYDKDKDGNVFDRFQTVIYGHNMKDGSMMHEIVSYKSKEYLSEHPFITIWTADGKQHQYEIFAAYYMAADKLPINFDDKDEAKREQFIEKIEKYCLSTPDVNDKIITLVTCEYSGDNYRMVVHARKV